MNIENEVQMLIDNRLLRTEQETVRFEKAVAAILKENQVEHIKYLCLGFHDKTEKDEVMFGLVHAIEAYDDTFDSKTTFSVFADSLPSMLPHANEWMKILHKRIINHSPSREHYSYVISSANQAIKEIVFQQLNEIKAKNPVKFEASVMEFLTAFRQDV